MQPPHLLIPWQWRVGDIDASSCSISHFGRSIHIDRHRSEALDRSPLSIKRGKINATPLCCSLQITSVAYVPAVVFE